MVPPFFNMLIKTRNKMDAVRDFINLWLEDKTQYCNNCGETYNPVFFSCCDNPQIASNFTHTLGLAKQNKELQKIRLNQYASTKDRTIRWGVSLPPKLYSDLRKMCEKVYNEKLFKDNGEFHSFMKKFPQFAIPKKI